MKRIFSLAFVAILAACNNTATTVTDSDTVASETIVTPDTAATVFYTPVDGDVIYKDGKVMVMRNGQWVETDKDITLENGVVIDKTGKAKRGKVEIKMEDGNIVSKTGNFFDKTGKAIDNAWEDTKDAVKDAGKAVGHAAEKVGKKIDTALDKDK
jgi:hypothetical protein